ncbi:aggrecan core protein isoform X4 [Ictalurus punctatus]|uniref:Aggrecan core protein isoform X4 n=1 Tax=Ictalurus punctatus TaxID=7998 RepID=A0A2D0PXF1_ICTPU|nr:aggrecan core protein isoform X4 [Ictalurus punctatus]
MLSRNLFIASVAFVFLATAVSAAPVEDKDPEENDFEAEEGEEELSEEEEDDDDSKGQHMKGAGAQQATMVPKGPGVTVLPGTSPVGEPPNGHKVNGAGAAQTSLISSSGSSAAAAGADGSNGRDSQALPSSSQGAVLSVAGHGSSGSKVPGAADTAYSDTVSHGSPSQVSLSHVSSGQVSSSHVSSLITSEQTSGSAFVSSEVQSQTEEAATTDLPTHEYGDNGESLTLHIGSQIEAPGSESVIETPETEANGNGHKQLINGQETGHPGMNNFMEGTTQIDSTGGFDSFGSNLEFTGIIDHSSHDFLIGLMGGIGDSFAPDPYTDTIADHMGLAFQVETTGAGLDPGLPAIISSARPAPQSAGNGLVASASVTSDNGAQYNVPGDVTEGAENNGADSPSINGNGRLRPVTDLHKGDPSGTDTHLYTTGEHHGLITHTHTETLDVKDPTIIPVTKIPSEAAVTSRAAGVGTQADVTAGLEGEPVTNGHRQIDITIMGDSIYTSRPADTLGYESTGVTEGISNHTDSMVDTRAGFTDASQTHSSVIQTELIVTGDPVGVSSQTDATGTAVAEPHGTLRGLSQPGATEQTQAAVSAGEQYHTSGQGPEGAENVELEDTC